MTIATLRPVAPLSAVNRAAAARDDARRFATEAALEALTFILDQAGRDAT
jgi:hypothetical protein